MYIPNRLLLQDYSANKPTLPAIGAAFTASGPYSGYVLVATVPADQGRQFLSVSNQSAAQIALVLDDGTTGVGSVPATSKATVVALAAAAAAGGAGGVHQDHFQGRVQVYASVSTAQVAIYAR
jgi:hypothetical protein